MQLEALLSSHKTLLKSQPLLVYFHPLLITIQIKIEKVKMLCLGIKPGAVGC